MINEILTITVYCSDALYVKGQNLGIAMIPFTGEASGPYFTGKIIGPGVDTQKISPTGAMTLSARYMLEGTDYTGQACRIFIENNGPGLENCTPTIVTDSAALSFWESAKLRANIECWENGVIVHVLENK